MSKQKKTKQPPVLGRLLEYAGGHKWLSVLGCGVSGVSAAVGIFPFVFVWYAARGILTPDSPQPKTDSHLCPPAYSSSLPSTDGCFSFFCLLIFRVPFLKYMDLEDALHRLEATNRQLFF